LPRFFLDFRRRGFGLLIFPLLTLLDRAGRRHSGAHAHPGKNPALQDNPENKKGNQENSICIH
jgi:hypothetical protein